MSTHIDAKAIRTGDWWVAEFMLNGREYGTQAKRLDLLDAMIRDAAALMTGLPETEFTISVIVDMPQYSQLTDEYKRASEAARAANAIAAETSRRVARQLRDDNLPMRDIGTLLGISSQRASQLIAA